MEPKRMLVAVLALFVLAGTIAGVPQTATAAGLIYACVNNSSGTIHVTGATGSCANNEILLVWGSQDQLAALQQAVTTLQGQVATLQSALMQATATIACLQMAPSGVDLIVNGCNLHIRSGGGSTDAVVNGVGNLIVGYNENFNSSFDRTGSHNVIIGSHHSYSSFGGLVAGVENSLSGPGASIVGGAENIASGRLATISGGFQNIASGLGSTVSGGFDHVASGLGSSVSGGYGNIASGQFATVSGGQSRSAPGDFDWAAGSLFEGQ
jgi:hypothetical protein